MRYKKPAIRMWRQLASDNPVALFINIWIYIFWSTLYDWTDLLGYIFGRKAPRIKQGAALRLVAPTQHAVLNRHISRVLRVERSESADQEGFTEVAVCRGGEVEGRLSIFTADMNEWLGDGQLVALQAV